MERPVVPADAQGIFALVRGEHPRQNRSEQEPRYEVLDHVLVGRESIFVNGHDLRKEYGVAFHRQCQGSLPGGLLHMRETDWLREHSTCADPCGLFALILTHTSAMDRTFVVEAIAGNFENWSKTAGSSAGLP